MAEISRELYVTADYLSDRFHWETGETLHRFIRRQKIAVAKEMLESSNLFGSEMFLSLGFSSQSHFIKVFKAETGMTPKEYRMQPEPRRQDRCVLSQYAPYPVTARAPGPSSVYPV